LFVVALIGPHPRRPRIELAFHAQADRGADAPARWKQRFRRGNGRAQQRTASENKSQQNGTHTASIANWR